MVVQIKHIRDDRCYTIMQKRAQGKCKLHQVQTGAGPTFEVSTLCVLLSAKSSAHSAKHYGLSTLPRWNGLRNRAISASFGGYNVVRSSQLNGRCSVSSGLACGIC